MTWGADDSPRTCVCLHGITANAGAWHAMGPMIAALGVKVVATELPGHGSTPVSDHGYRAEALIGDLLETIPADPDLLIGHSFGGYLAQQAVLDGLMRPRALILEDPVSHQPDPDAAAAMLEWDRVHLPREVDAMLSLNPGWSRLDAAWKVLSLEQVDFEAATAAFAGAAPWDLRSRAADVARLVPTVWVQPGESRFVPAEDLVRLRSDVGDDRVRVVAGAGHSIHRDAPDVFLGIARELLEGAA